jgi:bifunctional DNase/RNase
MVEMEVDSIRVTFMNYQRVVVLKEKTTNRYLPIWINSTKDTTTTAILRMTKLDSIIIDNLKDNTYHFKTILKEDGVRIETDSQPGDLALATRANVPIYIKETILDTEGILLSKEASKHRILTEEEKKRLAFLDFIMTLDIDTTW